RDRRARTPAGRGRGGHARGAAARRTRTPRRRPIARKYSGATPEAERVPVPARIIVVMPADNAARALRETHDRILGQPDRTGAAPAVLGLRATARPTRPAAQDPAHEEVLVDRAVVGKRRRLRDRLHDGGHGKLTRQHRLKLLLRRGRG